MYFRKRQILTYETINISLIYNYYTIIHLQYTSVKFIQIIFILCNDNILQIIFSVIQLITRRGKQNLININNYIFLI